MFMKNQTNTENAEHIVQDILRLLSEEPDGCDYWTPDGDEILCTNELRAEFLADFIDALYGDRVCCTGYYDPRDDASNGETDARTGFYYVIIN
jgi:hypothetical protein